MEPMGRHLESSGICGLAAVTLCLAVASSASAAEPAAPAPEPVAAPAPDGAPPADPPVAPPADEDGGTGAPAEPADGDPGEAAPDGDAPPTEPAAAPETPPAPVEAPPPAPPPPEPAATEVAADDTASTTATGTAATDDATAGDTTAAEGEGALDDDEDSWLSSIDVAAYLGLGVRLDDPPYFEVTQRAGALLGLGVDLYFTPELALGVAFEHLEAGEEGGALSSFGTMTLNRDLNSLWFRFRAYPLRNDDAGLFVAIGVAPTWQSAEGAGSVWSEVRPGNSMTFECEGAGSIDAALRAGIGADVNLAAGLRWITSVNFDTYQLGDEALDGCAPGSGTTAVFVLRSGFAYGIPVP